MALNTNSPDSEASTGPLADLRVLELGIMLAGPFCGQLLADFGAEVIKVEQPEGGDPMRAYGPARHRGKAIWWNLCARNKKSVTLNLREPEGQELVKALVAECDIVLENFRPGTLERWGLDYGTLSAINPGIILVRVSGFGQTGPYAKRPGYAAVGEAMGGLRYLVGEPDRVPSRTGTSLGDTLAGAQAAFGALLAVHHRTRTGRGQVLDASIYESVLTMMESLIPDFQPGHVRERSGSLLPKVAPSNVYPTRDEKLLIIAANQDTVFPRLAEAMERPELAEKDRYGLHEKRGEGQAELDALIGAWTQQHDLADLERTLEEHAVPFGTLFRAPEMLADPHYEAREAIVRLPMHDGTEIAMQNVFPKLSVSPGQVRSVGPELGAHTDEVLGELLGLGPRRLEELRAKGVI
jgi:formyl-CoA transferase